MYPANKLRTDKGVDDVASILGHYNASLLGILTLPWANINTAPSQVTPENTTQPRTKQEMS